MSESQSRRASHDLLKLNERLSPPSNNPIICRGSGVMRTLIPGTLTVLSAYPDPPFDIMEDGVATGFDIELMRAVCARLSFELRPLPYMGENFNGIFTELVQGKCDVVISGTTITPERAALECTEAVTLLVDSHVPDYVYEAARAEFSETELVDLTMAVVVINDWNRLIVSFRIPPAVARNN